MAELNGGMQENVPNICVRGGMEKLSLGSLLHTKLSSSRWPSLMIDSYTLQKCGKSSGISNSQLSSADPEGGGQGVQTPPPPPPLENHKLYGFLQDLSNWTPHPLWKKLDPPPLKKLDPLWNLENDSFLRN